MTLVFAFTHLYNILEFFIASVHSFFILFLNLVLINRRNGPRYQLVQSLTCFLNRGNTKRTNSSKILCLMFVNVLFYVNLRQDLFVGFGEFVV